MAVGAGSIKRVSKISAEAAETKKTVAAKATTKNTTAKKSATTKKTTEKSTKTDTELLQNTANKVYHITEELPIYLL